MVGRTHVGVVGAVRDAPAVAAQGRWEPAHALVQANYWKKCHGQKWREKSRPRWHSLGHHDGGVHNVADQVVQRLVVGEALVAAAGGK